MSGTPEQEGLTAQFVDITGQPADRAKFYLEAAGWELQVALGSYYESTGMEDDDPTTHQPDPKASNDHNAAFIAEPATDRAGTGPDLPRSRPPMGMATLDSLLRGSDSSSEDEGQAFYAGGSTTSGQQVLGPPRKKDRDAFIKDLFDKAKEHGATADEAGEGPSSGSSRSALRFAGTGYKLGDSNDTTPEVVQGAIAPVVPSGPREVILRLYRDGFTVDDGELRNFSDPPNILFLNAIKRGEIPSELTRSHPGQEIELAMEDKRTEDYKPPKPSVKPFGGKGQTLGNPAPTVIGSTQASGNMSAPDKEANEIAAKSKLNLSESEPQTNIQIRLADGSRLIGRFNHTHTVGDVYSYINTARPQYTLSNYILVLFPNSELTKKELSIKDANLLNAAVTQKMKP